MTKLDRYERLRVLREELKELGKQVNDMGVMIDAIDKGRNRLDLGLGDLNYSAEEMKGQINILKERQKWLIHQQDKFVKILEKLAKEIGT